MPEASVVHTPSKVAAQDVLSSAVDNIKPLLSNLEPKRRESTVNLIVELFSLVRSRCVETDYPDIARATVTAVRLHAPLGARLNGDSQANHVLRVAKILLTDVVPDSQVLNANLHLRDLIIAALLHDAVEDQADAVLGATPLCAKGPYPSEEKREQALAAMRGEFGQNVSELVRRLTNPDLKQEAVGKIANGSRKSKGKLVNQIYQRHFVDIALAPGVVDQGAFAVKLADVLENAPQHGIQNDSKDEGRAADAKRFQLKRGPLLWYLQENVSMLPETHILYPVREELSGKFKSIYERDYVTNRT